MIYDLAEQDLELKKQATRMAVGQVEKKYGEALTNTTGVYLAADSSLGDGFEYNDDGSVVEPPGEFWLPGMPVGSAPIQG